MFNDVAVSIRVLERERAAARRAPLSFGVVDLDVHQGNGTASILGGDVRTFTLSLHGEKNFPFRKEAERPRRRDCRTAATTTATSPRSTPRSTR